MSTKFLIENEQFKQLEKQLKELAGLDGVIRATESALQAVDDYVTRETEKAVKNSRHEGLRVSKRTGKQVDQDKTVEWNGTEAIAKAGFKITQPSEPGGINLTSQYLMYGTPHIKPDTNLKNAAKCEGIHRDKINKLQQEVFNKVINRVMEK